MSPVKPITRNVANSTRGMHYILDEVMGRQMLFGTRKTLVRSHAKGWLVRRIMTLGVELINDRDIVVSQPETGLSVTYRKDGEGLALVAIDGIDAPLIMRR